MPLEITFTLSDKDLDHFQAIVNKAKTVVAGMQDADAIETAARQLIKDARESELPEFIDVRLSKLELVINMMTDEEWQLSEIERRRILGALVYFCDPEDMIPDHIPGLGFLDDAIYIELIIRELSSELGSYEEFCAFRAAEEERRKGKGLNPHVEREQWLADKRAALHARMRSGRGSSGRGWRLRW